MMSGAYVRPIKTQLLLWPTLAMLFFAGCAGPGRATPAGRAVVTGEQDWGSSGKIVRSTSYTLYSTMNDLDFDQRLLAVMEAALLHYRALAPTVKIDPKPMEFYVFANRRQWAEFTRQKTGNDAAIYLQINRGGYTVRDFFVAYYLGESGTFAVSAHEGWHQFVARHFKDRLPPFLEEGLATTFENIRWDGPRPRFEVSKNASRAAKLADATLAGALWSLPELVSMHAGDVVGQPIEKIEAFYAQNWAFARFLQSGAGGKYKPALGRMMADAVAGELVSPISQSRRIDGSFNPRAVRPMLEHYLGAPLETIDRDFQAYIKEIAQSAGGTVQRE